MGNGMAHHDKIIYDPQILADALLFWLITIKQVIRYVGSKEYLLMMGPTPIALAAATETKQLDSYKLHLFFLTRASIGAKAALLWHRRPLPVVVPGLAPGTLLFKFLVVKSRENLLSQISVKTAPSLLGWNWDFSRSKGCTWGHNSDPIVKGAMYVLKCLTLANILMQPSANNLQMVWTKGSFRLMPHQQHCHVSASSSLK